MAVVLDQLGTLLLPFAVVFALVIAAVGYLITNRTAYGTVIRGAVPTAWRSLATAGRCCGYGSLLRLGRGVRHHRRARPDGDHVLRRPHGSANYTLLAIASVILGGGESPAGGRSPSAPLWGRSRSPSSGSFSSSSTSRPPTRPVPKE